MACGKSCIFRVCVHARRLSSDFVGLGGIWENLLPCEASVRFCHVGLGSGSVPTYLNGVIRGSLLIQHVPVISIVISFN